MDQDLLDLGSLVPVSQLLELVHEGDNLHDLPVRALSEVVVEPELTDGVYGAELCEPVERLRKRADDQSIILGLHEAAEVVNEDNVEVGHGLIVTYCPLTRKLVDITPMTMTLFSVELEEVQQHRQLWLGLSTAAQTYTGDRSEEAKHVIWVCNDEVAGIASIVPDMKKVGADNIYWRLRAMAIAPLHRGTGKGDEFLQAVIDFAKRKGCYPLYGASKESSRQLYERFGAIISEKPYDIADQGLHVDFVFAD